MKILIIGCGRMGIRHAVGISSCSFLNEITIVDISVQALINAKEQLSKTDYSSKFSYKLLNEISSNGKYDIGILATTAENRIELCKKLVDVRCKFVLIEKPLGQSMQDVIEIVEFFNGTSTKAYVNLNMRLYPDFIKVKNDLTNKLQFCGPRTVTINTGSLGIGANGIHYLDFLIYLFDADDVRLIDCYVDSQKIPSGRGPQFSDFGGWCLLEFKIANERVGNAFLSMSAESSVFGGWDILCKHGRITINESNGKRIDYIRKENSSMPINRYHADYLDPIISDFQSPFLGELTKLWIENLKEGKILLPEIRNTILSHKIMFEWLAKSHSNTKTFPIT